MRIMMKHYLATVTMTFDGYFKHIKCTKNDIYLHTSCHEHKKQFLIKLFFGYLSIWLDILWTYIIKVHLT